MNIREMQVAHPELCRHLCTAYDPRRDSKCWRSFWTSECAWDEDKAIRAVREWKAKKK